MNDTFMKYLPAMTKSLSNWLDAPSPGVSMQIKIPHTYNMGHFPACWVPEQG